MHGKNPITKQSPDSGNKLKVNDVFYSIQGEGPFSGIPAVIVRLAGCNLRCSFCDTDFDDYKEVQIKDLLNQVRVVSMRNGKTNHLNQTKIVIITGGEPLVQNIVPFVRLLNWSQFSIQIETNGTLWLPGLETLFPPNHYEVVHPAFLYNTNNTIICSPKTKSIHERLAPLITAFKYVVKDGQVDEQDGLPLTTRGEQVARPWNYPEETFGLRPRHIFVQPCDAGDNLRNITKENTDAAVKSCLKFGYRLCLQIHKLVDLP